MTGEVDLALKVIAAVLGVLAFVMPIAAAAAMWKMSKTFATRAAVRGAVARVERRVEEKVTQIERDIERGNKQLMAAIVEGRDATRADINGLGDRIGGVLKVAEMAISRADAAHHESDLIRAEVKSIDQHGTKKVAKLEEQISQLSTNLSLFNKLIEQGVLRPTRGADER